MGKKIETFRDYGKGPWKAERTVQLLTLNCPECHRPVRFVLAEEERQWKEMYRHCEEELVFFQDRVLELEARNEVLTKALERLLKGD